MLTCVTIRAPHTLRQKTVKLLLKLGGFGLEGRVAELAADLAGTRIRNGLILHRLRVP